jgi:uncharacterized membrane protein YfcA
MTTLWAVITVMLIATMVKALFGFGEALVAMPLLTLFMGVRTATPLVALMTTTTTGALVWQNRRNVELGSVWRLIVAAVVGVPIGVYFLRVVPEMIVTRGLGIVRFCSVLIFWRNLFFSTRAKINLHLPYPGCKMNGGRICLVW